MSAEGSKGSIKGSFKGSLRSLRVYGLRVQGFRDLRDPFRVSVEASFNRVGL